jgi:Ca-activated chloride channel family protein
MSLDDKTIPVQGTDIGRALDEGFQALDKSARQKILVLITDGEDLFDPKLTLAQLEAHESKYGLHTAQDLAKQGVTIFTVGVGTPAGAEIQTVNEQGKTELVRDSKGQVVQSRLDESTLRQIAQATGGSYYPLGPVGEGLGKVRLSVENLTGPSGSSPGQKLGVDRFQLPLTLVLVFLAGESLIGTRRRAAV